MRLQIREKCKHFEKLIVGDEHFQLYTICSTFLTTDDTITGRERKREGERTEKSKIETASGFPEDQIFRSRKPI